MLKLQEGPSLRPARDEKGTSLGFLNVSRTTDFCLCVSGSAVVRAGTDLRGYDNSCKAAALMSAALALSASQWYLLIDDDTAVRLPLVAAFASRFDPEERHAFGPYPCGAERCARLLRPVPGLRLRLAPSSRF